MIPSNGHMRLKRIFAGAFKSPGTFQMLTLLMRDVKTGGILICVEDASARDCMELARRCIGERVHGVSRESACS